MRFCAGHWGLHMLRSLLEGISLALRRTLACVACLIGSCSLWCPLANAQTTTRHPAATVSYAIEPGDSLYAIASRYMQKGNDWSILRRLNHVQNARRLRPGAVLRLPKALLKEERLSAIVAAISGPVKYVSPKGLVQPVTLGMSVEGGGRLHTGDDGFVTLEFNDDTHISIPHDSTVEISTLKRTVLTRITDRVIFLQRGEVDSEVTHATRKADQFQIRTPSAVAGVRGTHFRVSYDEQKQASEISVTEGTVAVDAAIALESGAGTSAHAPDAPTQLVPASFGTVTDSLGHRSGLIQLMPPPMLKNPEKVQDGVEVAFQLVPLSGASAYRIRVAKDANFLDVLHDRHLTVPQATFGDMPDANYFVGVSSIDRNGLEGFMKIYAFERRKLGVEASARSLSDRQFEFRWRVDQSRDSTRFRFILATSPDFQNPIVDQLDVAADGIVVTDLHPGTYYWMVVAEQFERGRLYQKSGGIHSFELDR
jgi:hypothetical protein